MTIVPQRRILIHSDAAESSATLQIRVLGPLRERGFRFEFANDSASVLARGEFDALVVHRGVKKNFNVYRDLLAQARQRGIPVVYETDDLLTLVPPEHPDYATYQSRTVYSVKALLDADLVITSTPTLAENLTALNPTTRVIPNELPADLWPNSETPPVRASHPSAPVVVGYVGTRTHAPDLCSVEDPLLTLLERHRGKVRFLSVGVPLSRRLREHPLATSLVPGEQVARSYPDYVHFAHSLAIDVGIAPLLDSPFNRCKSDIKFQEYSLLGIAGVYSRLPPHEPLVRHGETGFLATHPADWLAGLEALISSPDMRRRFVEAAVRSIAARRHLSPAGDLWERALEATRRRIQLEPPSTPHPLAPVVDGLLAYQTQLEKQLKRTVEYQVGKVVSRLTRKLAA